MLPRIADARYVEGHTIWLRFVDGTEGEVSLGAELEGEIFEHLRDKDYFKSFRLHPELRTVVWPNGADIGPETLHEIAIKSRHPHTA